MILNGNHSAHMLNILLPSDTRLYFSNRLKTKKSVGGKYVPNLINPRKNELY